MEFWLIPTHSRTSRSPSHPVAISPVPECTTGIDILRSWQNSHIGSLTCGVRAIMVGKAKWEPLGLLLPGKIVNQNEYCIPGVTAEITATIKDLKDLGGGGSHHVSL